MIKRLLDIISKIIIENIPFFIVLGILSLFVTAQALKK